MSGILIGLSRAGGSMKKYKIDFYRYLYFGLRLQYQMDVK